ncbi:MAG: LAGLIDADG family homing endonuclease [Candidatus Omnitrophica bacterium]|nr:LAGLIDADG family homing endonuclease [Candidatus Omnitrophota bacterium]
MGVQVPSPAFFMNKTKRIQWTHELAYAVGLITTDGNLSPDKRHIQFTTTDHQLAEQFNRCLNINSKIQLTPPSGFGKKSAYRINFSNVKLYRWLEQIGLKPRKTHSLGIIKTPKKYFPDFLRGHLDGDGSIFTYKDKYMNYKRRRYTYSRTYTAFNSSSFKHINWIRNNLRKELNIKGALNSWLKPERTVPLWTLRFAKKDSFKLLRWLYYKPNLSCLSRKREIAEQFLKSIHKNIRI